MGSPFDQTIRLTLPSRREWFRPAALEWCSLCSPVPVSSSLNMRAGTASQTTRFNISRSCVNSPPHEGGLLIQFSAVESSKSLFHSGWNESVPFRQTLLSQFLQVFQGRPEQMELRMYHAGLKELNLPMRFLQTNYITTGTAVHPIKIESQPSRELTLQG